MEREKETPPLRKRSPCRPRPDGRRGRDTMLLPAPESPPPPAGAGKLGAVSLPPESVTFGRPRHQPPSGQGGSTPRHPAEPGARRSRQGLALAGRSRSPGSIWGTTQLCKDERWPRRRRGRRSSDIAPRSHPGGPEGHKVVSATRHRGSLDVGGLISFVSY